MYIFNRSCSFEREMIRLNMQHEPLFKLPNERTTKMQRTNSTGEIETITVKRVFDSSNVGSNSDATLESTRIAYVSNYDVIKLVVEQELKNPETIRAIAEGRYRILDIDDLLMKIVNEQRRRRAN